MRNTRHGWLAMVAVCAYAARPVRELPPEPPLRMAVDLHQHLTMRHGLFFFQGEAGSGTVATGPRQRATNQIDVAGLRRAGLQVICAALWPRPTVRGLDALDEALLEVEALRKFIARRSDFGLALDAAAARHIVASGGIAVLPCLEGGEAITSVDTVDTLYAAGVRGLGLVHFTDNGIADAEPDQFGRVAGAILNDRGVGLTPLGRAAVERMMALGMVIDVAHSSPRTVDDVLALAEARGVPVVASHEGPSMKGRTLDDAQARRILKLQGLIGIGMYREDLLPPVAEVDRWPGFEDKSCDEMVAYWLHYAALGDPAQVVPGTDFSSFIDRAQPGGSCPYGVRHVGDLPWVFGALRTRGFPREALDDSAERYLRLLERVNALADPVAQAQARARHVVHRGPFDVPGP